jgi:FMN-dependent NADH-azoreductase
MARLLYVEASPRKQRSVSIEVSRAFLSKYHEANPNDDIQTLDIWALELPAFDRDALAAKYAGLSGAPLTVAQQSAWSAIRALAAPFLSADKLLFAVPMWNFGVPYRLKHLIDLISQKDILFTFNGKNFEGLMRARKAMVVCARGLDYSSPDTVTPAESYDFQKPYLEMWLRFIGVEQTYSLLVEKTLTADESDRGTRLKAIEKAVSLAAKW